jgi:hypothetical protein
MNYRKSLAGGRISIGTVVALGLLLIFLGIALYIFKKEVARIDKKLEKISVPTVMVCDESKTSFEAINEFVKSMPKGWNAEEMAQELERKFCVHTNIVTRGEVKYLFLRINCCPNWWWVTWKGLLSVDEAPVKP